MSRMVGTVSRGVRAPIIRSGDDLAQIVPASVLEAAAEDGFSVRDRDVIAMTEAIVARAQGNMPPWITSPPTCAPNWAARPSASSSPF